MAGDAAKLKKAPFVHLKLSDAARVDWFGLSMKEVQRMCCLRLGAGAEVPLSATSPLDLASIGAAMAQPVARSIEHVLRADEISVMSEYDDSELPAKRTEPVPMSMVLEFTPLLTSFDANMVVRLESMKAELCLVDGDTLQPTALSKEMLSAECDPLINAAKSVVIGMSTQLCGYTLARESYSYMQKGFAEVQRMEFIFVRQHLDLKQLPHEL